MDLPTAGGVKTILSGHLHYPREWRIDGMHLTGAPAVSFGLPEHVQHEGWTLVTVAPDGSCSAEVRFIPRAAASQTPTTNPSLASPG